jgi:hypothetical protein
MDGSQPRRKRGAKPKYFASNRVHLAEVGGGKWRYPVHTPGNEAECRLLDQDAKASLVLANVCDIAQMHDFNVLQTLIYLSAPDLSN